VALRPAAGSIAAGGDDDVGDEPGEQVGSHNSSQNEGDRALVLRCVVDATEPVNHHR